MVLSWPKRNRTIGTVDALGLVGILGFLAIRFIPLAKLPFWSCPFRRATGWPCLGCGLTRAADRFVHGRLIGAFEVNPLGALAACVLALCVAGLFLHLCLGAPLPSVSLSPKEAQAARVLLILAILTNYAYVVLHTKFPGILG